MIHRLVFCLLLISSFIVLSNLPDLHAREILQNPLPVSHPESSGTEGRGIVLTPEEKAWLNAHPVIRVMGETDYPPWDFVQNGQPVGYGIDYVKLLAERIGVELVFEIAPYEENLRKVQKRELDLLHTTSAFELDGVLFSKSYGRFLQVIIARADRSDIKVEQDLAGKQVAIAKGDEGIQMLQRNVSGVGVVEVSGYREVLLAVLDGRADAGIMDRAVSDHLIRKHLLSNLVTVAEVAGSRLDPNQGMRLGVRSDWPEFLAILQKAMDSVTTAEMDALNQKWLRSVKKEVLQLTQSERAWLAKHPSIRLGFNPDIQPLLIHSETEAPKGIIPDIFAELEALTGLKISIEVKPWQETIEQARQGKIDGLALSVPVLATDIGLLATNEYISTFPVVFAKKDAGLTINSLDDLRGKRVAYLKAVKFLEEILARYQGEVTVIEAETFIESLTLMLEGKADVVLGMNYNTYCLNQFLLPGIEPAHIDSSYMVKAATAVRPDWPELVGILNKGLNAIGDVGINQIIWKWTQLEPFTTAVKLTESEKQWLKTHPVIRVGHSSRFEPAFIKDTSGSISGILPDLYQLVASRLGVTFELIDDDWPEILHQVRSSEIDFVGIMNRPTAQKLGLLTVKPLYSHLVTVFARKNRHFQLFADQDLNGLRVAYYKDIVFLDRYFENRINEIQPVKAASPLEALQRVLEGTADVAIGFNIHSYYLTKYNIREIEPVYVMKDLHADTATAIRPDAPVLGSILEKAISSISNEERNNVLAKWSWVPKGKRSTGKIYLSNEEKAWLERHPVINLTGGILPPIDYVDKNGNLRGYAPEYMRVLGDLIGIRFNLVSDTWIEATTKLRDKKVDGMRFLHITQEKEEFIAFTNPYSKVLAGSVWARKGTRELASVDDFQDENIGVVIGSSQHQYLEDHIPDKNIVSFSKYEEGLDLLMDGKIDLLVAPMLVIQHHLAAKLIYDIELKFIVPELSRDVGIGIRKDWTELVSILNKAIAAVPEHVKSDLATNWRQGGAGARARVQLTSEEKAWLHEHPVVRVGVDSAWAPIEFLDSDRNYKGLSIEYLKKIEPLLGVEFEIVRENWQELISRAQKRELDLFTCVASTPEKQKYLLFTEPYVEMPSGIFAKEEVAYIADLNKIAGEKIAVVDGYAIHEYLKTNYPNLDLLLVKTPEEGILRVRQDRAFAFVGNIITTGHLIVQKGYLDIKLAGEIEFVYAQSMGVRKDWPQFRNILQKAINAISDSEQNAIYNQWVPVIHEKPADYSIFWKTGAGLLVTIFFIVFWNLKLKSEVSKKTAEIKENEQKYHSLFQFSRDGIVIFSLDRQILDANQRFLNLSGFTRDDVLSFKLPYLFPKSQSSETARTIQSLLDGNEIDLFETVLRCRNKEEKPVEISVTKLEGCYGKEVVFQSNIRDITYRKRRADVLAARLRLSEFSTNHTVDELLQNCLDEAEELTGSSIGFFHFLGSDQNTLTLQMWSTNTLNHMCTAEGIDGHHHIDQAGVWGDGVRERTPVIHNDYASLQNRKGMPKGHAPVVRELVVPIFREGKIVAIIGVGNKASDYGREDIKAVEDLSDFAWDIVQRKKAEEEKLETEKRLTASFNHRFQLTGLLTPEGKLLMANENVCRFAGVDFDEIEGKYLWELPHWGHSKELQIEIREAVQSAQQGNLINFETTHVDSDGKIHYIDFCLTPVHDEEGNVIFLVPESYNITERKLAEKAIRESEMKYRIFFENTPDPMLMLLDNRFFDCNTATADLLGYESKDELIDASPWMISPEYQPDGKKSDEKARDMIKTAYRKGTHRFEWDHKRKDGSVVPVEVSLTAIPEHGKEFLLVVCRDLTERKKLDHELRLVKHSIEHSTYPFFWIKKDAQFFYVNEAACQSLGYSNKELVSMKVSDIDPEFPPEVWLDFWEEIKSKKHMVFESVHLKKNKGTFPVEIVCNHLDYEGNQHLFVYVRDISEKLKHEEEQKAMQIHLQQAQKMEAIGTLAGGIAHDFNNILGGIFGYAHLVEKHKDNPIRITKYVDGISNAAQRATNLTQQILTFSRQTEFLKEHVDLYIIVKEVIKLIRSTFPANIEIQSSVNSNCSVYADPTKMHQVLMNLCTNAYHAMDLDGGILSVSLDDNEAKGQQDYQGKFIPEGKYVKLIVSDTGHGMDKATMEKAFEPYFTTKEIGKGTGMGLALVQAIVEEHQGYLNVHSVVNEGTRFEVYLPTSSRTVEEKAVEDTLAVNLEGTESIMLVDDEIEIRMTLKEILQDSGYQVTTFADGAQALEDFKNRPTAFDLIITDMAMPNITGDELAKQILNIRDGTPIILCSGYSEKISRDEALELGIDTYLEKPVSGNKLLASVREVLNRRND